MLRLIYMDEAGTSQNEPMRVVAAVIIHGDNEFRDVAQALEDLADSHVPVKFRKDFHFHGLEVFNGGKIDRQEWPRESRLAYFKAVLGVPQKHGLPVAIGAAVNGAFDGNESMAALRIPKHELEHIYAFNNCIDRADFFLRKYLSGAEIGTVVAEDVPRMKEKLALSASVMQKSQIVFTPEMLRSDAVRAAFGEPLEPAEYGVKHIIDTPHFVAKRRAPLLQLADAVAFAVRRCLARQAHGDDLVAALLGPEAHYLISDPVWQEKTNGALFNTYKYWSDEQKAVAWNRGMALAIAKAIGQSSHSGG